MPKATEKIQIRVRGEEYDRGPGKIFNKLYKATNERAIWIKILENHAYGYDEEEYGELTIPELIEIVHNGNADGCDSLFSIEKEVNGSWVPVDGFVGIEEDEEEDLG